jgi:hypothetical protein
MNSISVEIKTLIIEEVFYSFCFERDYLNLRVLNKTFNQIILRIIFRNPFIYFKEKKLLICLYIYYIGNLDNTQFFITHKIDLKLVVDAYLIAKKIDKERFYHLAMHTKDYRLLLKEFDYYEFICSFCELCIASNGVFSSINRFDLAPDKLEKSLQYILKNYVLVDEVNLRILNFYLELKYEENARLFALYKSVIPFKEDEMESLLNVKQVKLKVDFLDYDAIWILNKLDHVEKVYIIYYNYCFLMNFLNLFTFVFIFNVVI